MGSRFSAKGRTLGGLKAHHGGRGRMICGRGHHRVESPSTTAKIPTHAGWKLFSIVIHEAIISLGANPAYPGGALFRGCIIPVPHVLT